MSAQRWEYHSLRVEQLGEAYLLADQVLPPAHQVAVAQRHREGQSRQPMVPGARSWAASETSKRSVSAMVPGSVRTRVRHR
jgi:hypothetical protein